MLNKKKFADMLATPHYLCVQCCLGSETAKGKFKIINSSFSDLGCHVSIIAAILAGALVQMCPDWSSEPALAQPYKRDLLSMHAKTCSTRTHAVILQNSATLKLTRTNKGVIHFPEPDWYRQCCVGAWRWQLLLSKSNPEFNILW